MVKALSGLGLGLLLAVAVVLAGPVGNVFAAVPAVIPTPAAAIFDSSATIADAWSTVSILFGALGLAALVGLAIGMRWFWKIARGAKKLAG